MYPSRVDVPMCSRRKSSPYIHFLLESAERETISRVIALFLAWMKFVKHMNLSWGGNVFQIDHRWSLLFYFILVVGMRKSMFSLQHTHSIQTLIFSFKHTCLLQFRIYWHLDNQISKNWPFDGTFCFFNILRNKVRRSLLIFYGTSLMLSTASSSLCSASSTFSAMK